MLEYLHQFFFVKPNAKRTDTIIITLFHSKWPTQIQEDKRYLFTAHYAYFDK